jgi:hypothetical protein
MTIDEIELTAEEAVELVKLKENFNIRNQKSPASKAHRTNEIKIYSMIFDEDKLPLPKELKENDEPLKGYSGPELCSMQIWLIREFWIHFIVEENDIAEIEKNEYNSWFWNLNDFASEWLTKPRYYYSKAIVYCKYLEWLNQDKKQGITNSELALIAFYNGEKVLRGKNPTKLYQEFKYFEFEPNRTGPSDSAMKNKNQIKLFENVIRQLSGNARIRAERDLSELKKNITGAIFFERDLKDLKK